MARIRKGDRQLSRPSERPEPLGRVPASAERLTAAVERSLPLMRYRPSDPHYWPPLTSDADHRAIIREENFRARELADLPDDGMIW